MIPPWGNLFIELLKSTALVSLITLSDLDLPGEDDQRQHDEDDPDLHHRRC
jgi:ABC-type amino acid transport system permease subunit